MRTGSRILLIGGHEFNRRSGNDAICDLIVELADSAHPRICLLPTASGDAEDQIASFRRAFGERDCDPSAISLFRLGDRPMDVREHLLAQDVVYVGGGSLVNLLAIWSAHGIDLILRECLEEGILICGQSAGAMCWFEHGVTSSSGVPEVAPGLGVLAGSACVHYSQPARRLCYRRAVGAGAIPAGIGLEDQTAAIFEDGHLAESITARDDARVWEVAPATDRAPARAGEADEHALPSRRIEGQRPAIDAPSPEVLEFRQTLAARAAVRRTRRHRGTIGRLD